MHQLDTKVIAELYAKGHTLVAVSEILGISASAVYDRLRRAGIPRRKQGVAKGPPRRTEEMNEFRKRGDSYSEIARKLGCSRQNVWSTLNQKERP